MIKKGNKLQLRPWQEAALTKYLSELSQDFLAVATPGSGKTTFALRVATELIEAKKVSRVIVVVPTEHLKHQWSSSAARVGLSLDSNFSNSGRINSSYDGIVVTYAQVSLHPYKHYSLATAERSLVILDEIHHGGDSKSWGDGIRLAYTDADYRLALTGTPFRSDDATIPFVRYVEDAEGHVVSSSDYTYGYSEALADGVVRPVVFLAYSGEASWRTSAGEEYTARLGEPLTAEDTARAWRTALDPHGDWIPAVLKAAHIRLQQLRRVIPDAGGLVIASNKDAARAYGRILETLSDTPVSVVLSDEDGSSQRIADFAESTDEWMVAVRMVSEGVDVPRLAVGVYATSASTPLFFAQAIGRFVRSRRRGETAFVFLPSVPVLLELAAKLEESRDHVLGRPHRPNEGWDDDLLADANRTQTELDVEEKGFESLGALAELDSLIYEGSTYGTSTLSGSAEEAEYLGIPGLLDPDQMRTLLSKRQEDQLNARTADQEKMRQQQAQERREAQEQHSSEGEVAAQEIPQLRKKLNNLVSIESARTGRPHGAIHNEVRKACGGPPTALASAQQLRDRIAYLRRW